MSSEIKKKVLEQALVDLRHFVDEFGGESDRAVVILAAARLDYLLYQILQKVLRPNPTGSDELLDGDRPLTTFSARINMAFRLCLIGPDFARALHMIRKIRNSFAHESAGISLDSGSHKDRIRELIAPLRDSGHLEIVEQYLFPGAQPSPAQDFRTAIAVAIARLEGCIQHVKPIDASNQYPLMPPAWTP